ncbi:hypothetical protein TNCV_4307181 [Trichonephila clavipes]|nr:hypothetical protein TNCV_4307181 [Trichonephila clavipes]
MALSLVFNENDTEWEFLSENDEYNSDCHTDLSICYEEDEEMEQKGQYTSVTLGGKTFCSEKHFEQFHKDLWKSVESPSIVPSENFAELIRTVPCMVLKVNDKRTSSPVPR